MVEISGGDKFEAAMANLAKKLGKKATLRVGFFDDKRYPDGTPVAMVAALNNFGGGSTPPRPFFTNAIAEHSPEWGEKIEQLLDMTGGDIHQALSLMGEVIADQIRMSIMTGSYAPNSPVTDLLKQRFPMGKTGGMTAGDVWQAFSDVAAGARGAPGKPLIWEGTMLDSVSYNVED